jgi:hypothetical protein
MDQRHGDSRGKDRNNGWMAPKGIKMGKTHKVGWFVGGMIGIFFFQGCDSVPVSLGGSYDLTEYLFPRQSGTLVYKLYEAKKIKGESSFTQSEYKEDVQYTLVNDGTKRTLTNRNDAKYTKIYTIEANQMSVEESDENLTYHLDRTVNSSINMVQEKTVKKWQENCGDISITYECNATGHLPNMIVEPNPKQYVDILKIECLRKHTFHAIVGGKKFETIVEDNEENFYAKDQGMIQSTVTQCEYTGVDDVQTSEDGCTQNIYKRSTFVPD